MNQSQQGAWWKEAVIYQVYPKSFYDSNNDGTGDIQGIIAKLPYLKTLGITMIWVSPFYLSPGADNGYDIADYYAVNPDLGQLQDIDDLIKQAGELGIGIMVDLWLIIPAMNTAGSRPRWRTLPQNTVITTSLSPPLLVPRLITGVRFLAAARGKKWLAKSATICTFFIKNSPT